MSEPATIIRIVNGTKWFPTGVRHRSLLRTLTGLLKKHREPGDSFAALSSVDFEVRRGDRIGLIGNNGAGKSTLLRVIAGIHPLSSGSVEVTGERTLLAGLGVGMIDELNVEHNVFLYGAMHGVPREDMKGQLEEVLEWAELSGFRYAKLKNLSTGMRSRLAFSVTRYFKADIYLLDEALTAGDRVFKKKCDEAMEKFWQSDRTMVVASHDLGFVRRHCNRVLWLERGKRVGFGETEEVLPLYEKRKAEGS